VLGETWGQKLLSTGRERERERETERERERERQRTAVYFKNQFCDLAKVAKYLAKFLVTILI
jgi:hypothetical protein